LNLLKNEINLKIVLDELISKNDVHSNDLLIFIYSAYPSKLMNLLSFNFISKLLNKNILNSSVN
jgi:hypothetical protein